jgi:hypothetical protein
MYIVAYIYIMFLSSSKNDNKNVKSNNKTNKNTKINIKVKSNKPFLWGE